MNKNRSFLAEYSPFVDKTSLMSLPIQEKKNTNWEDYYAKPFPASSITRRITGRRILRALKPHIQNQLEILELGGGNSAFFEILSAAFAPRQYTAVDNSSLGIRLFQEKFCQKKNVFGFLIDIFDSKFVQTADLVFSTGLIEHFDKTDTARMISRHFELARPHGVVLLTFPTPTMPYRFIRWAAEVFGKWAFPDERPLLMSEVHAATSQFGEILSSEIIWTIGLTQGLIVARKRPN